MEPDMLPPEQCHSLRTNTMLVVAPNHGLIWCPNAKVGTTTWYEILRRRLMPEMQSMPRCFPGACPDRREFKGSYPLMLPKDMPADSGLCDRRRFVSFTFVRNPWDRLASAYLSKIEPSVAVRDRQAQAVQEKIRFLFGLPSHKKISFGQFVRWAVQQNASMMNPHWKPHSERCDTKHTPYEFIGRYETMQEDILHVLGLLGWSPALIPATHWSSVHAYGAARNLSRPLTLSQKLRHLYSDPQLIELVAHKYRDDIQQFGYTFPVI